jgi:hypothetical protein
LAHSLHTRDADETLLGSRNPIVWATTGLGSALCLRTRLLFLVELLVLPSSIGCFGFCCKEEQKRQKERGEERRREVKRCAKGE